VGLDVEGLGEFLVFDLEAPTDVPAVASLISLILRDKIENLRRVTKTRVAKGRDSTQTYRVFSEYNLTPDVLGNPIVDAFLQEEGIDPRDAEYATDVRLKLVGSGVNRRAPDPIREDDLVSPSEGRYTFKGRDYEEELDERGNFVRYRHIPRDRRSTRTRESKYDIIPVLVGERTELHFRKDVTRSQSSRIVTQRNIGSMLRRDAFTRRTDTLSGTDYPRIYGESVSFNKRAFEREHREIKKYVKSYLFNDTERDIVPTSYLRHVVERDTGTFSYKKDIDLVSSPPILSVIDMIVSNLPTGVVLAETGLVDRIRVEVQRRVLKYITAVQRAFIIPRDRDEDLDTIKIFSLPFLGSSRIDDVSYYEAVMHTLDLLRV